MFLRRREPVDPLIIGVGLVVFRQQAGRLVETQLLQRLNAQMTIEHALITSRSEVERLVAHYGLASVEDLMLLALLPARGGSMMPTVPT